MTSRASGTNSRYSPLTTCSPPSSRVTCRYRPPGRASAEKVSTAHRVMSSGSVHAANTSPGRAWIVRTDVTESPFFKAPPPSARGCAVAAASDLQAMGICCLRIRRLGFGEQVAGPRGARPPGSALPGQADRPAARALAAKVSEWRRKWGRDSDLDRVEDEVACDRA